MAQSGRPQRITWVKTGKPSSGNFVMRFPENSGTETFVKGDPVVLDTDGQVKIAPDNGSIFGIADEDASGTTNTLIKVIIISDDDIFRASQSAAGATQVSAQTQVGLKCSFIKSTITGQEANTVVDISDTGNANLEVLGLRDTVGTSEGEVYFRFVRGVVAAR